MRTTRWMVVTALAAGGGLMSCSGGGGGGGTSFKSIGSLLAVDFLDPNDVNSEGDAGGGANQDLGVAPQASPLTQQIRFTFSAAPDPARINSTVLPILGADNIPVAGTYAVDGPVVTFTPTLPVRAIATTASGTTDDGGAGLDLNTAYTVRVGSRTFSFVAAVDAKLRTRYPDPLDSKGIFINFRTMPAANANAFRGVESRAPNLVAVDPVDGSVGISPNLFSDPDGLFAPRPSFRLTFDAPINPDPTQLNDTIFELLDLDDRPGSFPLGVPLGIDVALVTNETDRAIVEVTPTGILPFGHLLALQFDVELKGLSELGTPAGGPVVASTFTVADDTVGAIHDMVVEAFDDNVNEESSIEEIGNGNLPSDWNRLDSSVLQAALEFDGTGQIGRFAPTAPTGGDTTTIFLDTASQGFPLLDGSTPDAPPGLVVTGGVFNFTDVIIPDGVIIKVAGSNPLVFKCTGTVQIAGDIVIAGDNGSSEYAYDSAITSIPGGPARAGGGTGGDSHPVAFYPPDEVNYLTLVSPVWAATGFGMDPVDGVMKRIGGTGAQNGILERIKDGKYQTDNEFGNCDEFRNGNGECKMAGGGGGSMLRAGTQSQDGSGNRLNGVGNVVPDGTGNFIFDVNLLKLQCGDGGAHPFAPDGTLKNDFYGKLGQLTRLIGGQGGGGGATLTDSYFCGNWCDLDANPSNDGVCDNKDNLPANGRAPSVGDSRGGAGGGGGGGFQIQALGSITLTPTGSIDAKGGNGGGGEGIACSYWGGGGGGGAGGMVILQSASTLLLESGSYIDVRRGTGAQAANDNDYFDCSTSGDNPGDGGNGGHGLIQLQVPAGTTATVINPGTTDTNGSVRPPSSWIDGTNTLAPVEFTPVSIALSKWFDFGRVITRAPFGTNPVFSFSGTNGAGFVVTDGSGNVVSPETADIVCGYLGQIDPDTLTYLPGEEPRPDFIPPNATVRVEFQGADALAEGSKEIDPATQTAWSGSVSIASGKQFLRWRVTFDLTADASVLSPSSRRPIVERIQVHVDF
ncbi:MAG: hypothetical protein FJ293_09325 [Planctomycetes bacterium]|nr:hypothetical protein [Planctomycetota bacterium]